MNSDANATKAKNQTDQPHMPNVGVLENVTNSTSIQVEFPGSKSNRCNNPTLKVERCYVPNRIASLQALRIVLGLPRMVITLDERNTPWLAIPQEKSDISTLTRRTEPEVNVKGGNSGQEE